MARRRKYKLRSSSRGCGFGCLYWVGAVLILGGLVWVWLQSREPVRPTTPAPAPTNRGAPPAPRRVTPAPAPVSPPVQPAGQRNGAASNASVVRPGQGANVPRVDPNHFPRPPLDTFEAQLALARLGISSGPLDGVMGSQTRSALRAFQQSLGVFPTGELDDATRSRLRLESAPVVSHWVSSNDLARLQPVASTWLGKSQQSALEFETILELVSEVSHANPKLIRALNPGVNWSNVTVGTQLRVPDAAYPEPVELAAFVRISLSGKTLQAFGARSNLLAHFPCSIAQRVEKRPTGELRVTAIAPNPNYTFNPEVFPESAEAQALGRKLILQPGPNNPVGVAWISLDRPGYGIHGTPNPEQVGRTESHGCFRLANWNAEFLLKLVRVGTPVWVEP